MFNKEAVSADATNEVKKVMEGALGSISPQILQDSIRFICEAIKRFPLPGKMVADQALANFVRSCERHQLLVLEIMAEWFGQYRAFEQAAICQAGIVHLLELSPRPEGTETIAAIKKLVEDYVAIGENTKAIAALQSGLEMLQPNDPDAPAQAVELLAKLGGLKIGLARETSDLELFTEGDRLVNKAVEDAEKLSSEEHLVGSGSSTRAAVATAYHFKAVAVTTSHLLATPDKPISEEAASRVEHMLERAKKEWPLGPQYRTRVAETKRLIAVNKAQQDQGAANQLLTKAADEFGDGSMGAAECELDMADVTELEYPSSERALSHFVRAEKMITLAANGHLDHGPTAAMLKRCEGGRERNTPSIVPCRAACMATEPQHPPVVPRYRCC
eukprot:TRINITY_DN6693_c0_g1_i1.p1 TRINITY_DN6693_c0_g1~~TRINITY_DN6693_c0_g1_i1.p1  ORF type:complete len:388 (+),score=90.92 TRINITY_DN6693_c0_g1_i1:1-1164(+)